MTYDQLLDMLRAAEPTWKTNLAQTTQAQQQEIYTRPAEKRISRFRFDQLFEDSGSLNGGGGDDNGPGTPPTPLAPIECSGNLNGEANLRILYGPTGQE